MATQSDHSEASEHSVIKSITLWCSGCQSDVQARLTDGQELYPHRPDLYELPFWKCDTCGAYVGCHHKTKNRTAPLGCLASQDIMNARKKIHALLDPLWKSDKIKRGKAYAYVTNRMIKLTGDQTYQYHNGEIRSLEEARSVYRIVAQLHNEVNGLVPPDTETTTDTAKKPQNNTPPTGRKV